MNASFILGCDLRKAYYIIKKKFVFHYMMKFMHLLSPSLYRN